MRQFFSNLLRDDAGQDLAEYALLIALVALAVVVAVDTLGGNISNVFDDISTELTGATGP
ncbi:MAG: Flp family type IVb pilin [Gemmatimonadota bacterium]